MTITHTRPAYRMNRTLDSMLRDMWSTGAQNSRYPETDVYSDEQGFHIEMNLPGMSRDQLEIELADRVLRISSKSQEKKETEKQNYLLKERRSREFSRRFGLPGEADPSKLSAQMKNGVLRVSIERKPEVKPKKIVIS